MPVLLPYRVGVVLSRYGTGTVLVWNRVGQFSAKLHRTGVVLEQYRTGVVWATSGQNSSTARERGCVRSYDDEGSATCRSRHGFFPAEGKLTCPECGQ